MLHILKTRLRQGYRTVPYPDSGVARRMPERFRGIPAIDSSKCLRRCGDCETACPVEAIRVKKEDVEIDLGRCLFCSDCAEACPEGAIRYSRRFQCAVRKREDLILRSGETLKLAEALEKKTRRLFGRSLKLRQVSAGGCNGCELDVNVLNTVVFDIARFGIQFAASPRHADGLLVTGPVSNNMKTALKKTYNAVPSPRLVIAAGACAISGGPYFNHSEVQNGAGNVVPVDLYIPGCPPHPLALLDGLLRFLGRLDQKKNY